MRVSEIPQTAGEVIHPVDISGEERAVPFFNQQGRQFQMTDLFGQQGIFFQERRQHSVGVEDVGVLVSAIERTCL